MTQANIKTRAEQILFPNEDTCIPASLRGMDIFLSIEQLHQLIDEKIVECNSSSNARPTLQEFLDFGNSLVSFLNADGELQLEFFGSVSFALNQILLSLDMFKLRCKEENLNIERAIEILPIVSKFIYEHGADEFTCKQNLFSAWWD